MCSDIIKDTSGAMYHLPAKTTLTLDVYPEGAGTVSFNGITYENSVTESGYGADAVTCYAKPAEGWEFLGWYDMSVGRVQLYDETHETLRAVMPEKDSTWTALFKEKDVPKYNLEVTYGEGGWVDTASVNGQYAVTGTV